MLLLILLSKVSCEVRPPRAVLLSSGADDGYKFTNKYMSLLLLVSGSIAEQFPFVEERKREKIMKP
jgi:hypothetical protein